MLFAKYDIIVIGAGHAGCEAALIAAKMNTKVLLLTGNIDNIGHMSCNPSIGGLGKGHLVREIDALGGEMAINTDETGIQFRKLNTKKGTAVQGTRAQADMYLYKQRMRYIIEKQENLSVKQGIVKRLLKTSHNVEGVELTTGEQFFSRAIVITTGTFLRGLCHIGMKNFSGGRAGDMVANDLTDSLIDCGFDILRLKTGTVPRLDGKTINWGILEEQWGDTPLPTFSFTESKIRQKQVCCHITYTNPETHDIIYQDLDKSPLFQGVIQGVGPRYCPSVEDKVFRFRDKDRHQIFLEPEGLMTREIYPSGLSTSLPLETQIRFLRSITGLENVEVTRAGYAVEYDAVNPLQLKASLESKNVAGLFLAGQINGTSGYEEAAAQGLMAGINAARFCMEQESVIIKRDQGYIGVMIDDLVTKGIGGEPYRMFTSRSEYRLILREDNADVRLTPLARDLGTISAEKYEKFEKKMDFFAKTHEKSQKIRLNSLESFFNEIKKEIDKEIPINISLEQLIKWPEMNLEIFNKYAEFLPFDQVALEEISPLLFSEIKYRGYIDRYDKSLDKTHHFEKIKIPLDFDFQNIPSLSHEVKQKLIKHRPDNLKQASLIPGITPAAVSHLHVYITTKRLRDSI